MQIDATKKKAADEVMCVRGTRIQATLLFVIASLLCLPLYAQDKVNPAGVFSDHMILQRDMPVPVWGWAEPGEVVTVEFAGQKKSATADKIGNWLLRLDPMKASAEPRELKIADIKLTDILVGDVWICSGQSNMQRPFWGNSSKYKNGKIRLLRIPGRRSNLPLDNVRDDWISFESGLVRNFTGVGLFFGCNLQKALDVPIGLIHITWSGSPIEPWIGAEGYDLIGKPLKKPDMSKLLSRQNQIIDDLESWLGRAKRREEIGKITVFSVNTTLLKRNNFTPPAAYFNGMIAPLAPFGVKGVLWYQGESNRKSVYPDYFTKLQALIGGWRQAFEAPELPFYLVQIAPFNYTSNTKEDDNKLCDNVWTSQYRAAKEIKNCEIIPIHDSIRGNVNDIHPMDKKPVGDRLAAMVLNKLHGKDVVCTGPVFSGAKRQGAKVIVSFDKIDKGLETADGKPPTWFELSTDGKIFVPADAVIDGAHVVVSSAEITEPKFVRMGWSEIAIPSLRDKNGWPAFQFAAMPVE